MKRLWNRLLPPTLTKWARTVIWLSLIANIVIVGSGGTVRLTDSGLGCTDAVVACTSNSFFPTPEEGVHGIIEFSNRCVTGLLVVIAILAVLAVWRYRRFRKDLWIHAWIIIGGITVDAVLGGVVVDRSLNVWTVGAHFLISMILIGVAASMVIRSRRLPGAREHVVALGMRILTHVTTLLLAAELVLGVFTTGTGPHSGDANVLRDTKLWDTVVHIHSWVGYGLGTALLVLLISAIVHRERRFTGAVIANIALVVVQIAVGLIQARIGLPPVLVGIHMVLAAITVALMVLLVDATKAPVVAATDAELEDQADDGELNGSVGSPSGSRV